MNQFFAIVVAGIGLLWTIEGIARAIVKKRHWAANIVNIIYPAFVFIVMIYFLMVGVIN